MQRKKVSRLLIAALCLGVLQTSVSNQMAQAAAVPASNDPQTIPFVGITPTSNSWTRLITGITGGPTQLIFDDSGNGWGLQNRNCLVKVVPNAAGTSVTVEPKYGTSGSGCATTPAVSVTAGNNQFNYLGNGTAGGVAWLDSSHILIVTQDRLYTWDVSVTPSLSALSQYSTLGGSKITLDSQGNIYVIQSSANNGAGSQNKIVKILQVSPNTGETVLTAGTTFGNSCGTFGYLVMSPSDILYATCATGGSSSKTFFVNFATNTLTQFANAFANGPMAIDALGNIYIAQTLNIQSGGAGNPILTKYGPTGLVLSYWPYDADREGVSIDAAGNVYAYHPWGYIDKVAGTSPPFPPTRVAATAGNTSATVSWLAPSLAGFTTYTATASPGGGTCTTTWPVSTCSIPSLNGGSNYSVSVTASNATGVSAPSGSASVTPYSVAAAPTIGNVSGTSATSVSIPYTAGATNGSAITGFTTTSSPSVVLTLTSAATANPLTYSGTFVIGQAYTFSMTATNGAGPSSSSGPSNSITPNANVQTISFDALTAATLGVSSAPLIRGSASSGLGVSYSSATPGVCVVSGSLISMLSPGTCTITASQAGNGIYSAAASVSQSFLISAKPDDGQKELMEILTLLPGLATISKNIGDLAVNNMTKCVKGKLVKRVKLGAKCPKGYVKRK